VRRALATAAAAAGLLAPAQAHAAGQLAPYGLSVSWVGDMAFSSDQGLPPGGPGAAFASVRSYLKADLVTGNLEGTLATGGSSKCPGGSGGTCFSFRAPPSYAFGFRHAGFDLLNVANNHANDYGGAGQSQTSAALRSAGIAYAGRPGQITILHVNGLRVAAMGFAPYPWTSPLLDIPAAAAMVRDARSRANIVICFIHQGAEGADKDHVPYGPETAFGENRGSARAFAHAMIDAGATLVLGSGPHVIRGIERYHRRMIAYSLGNFAGPHTLGLGGNSSLSAILNVNLTPGGLVSGGRWVPLVMVSPGLPRYDPAHRSAALVRALSREDFGSRRYAIGADGTIAPDPAIR